MTKDLALLRVESAPTLDEHSTSWIRVSGNLAVYATCPRYPAVRSELEHCEPLALRVPL